MTDRIDAIIVGAGHNGLVCGAYLARAGRKVVCLESREAPGGMAAPRSLDDEYHFPPLAHLAYPLSPRIQRELKLDQFGYSAGPEIETVALAEKGEHLTIGTESVSGPGLPDDDARAYPAFRRELRDFARALRPLFEDRPPRLKNMRFNDRKTLARLGWNVRMGLGRDAMYELLRVAGINVFDMLNDTFEHDRLKGALAAEAVLGNAMGPRTPGSVLVWLQRLHGALNGPLALQVGGRRGLVDALARSAEAAGASVRLNTPVQKVLVENGKAAGVKLASGETLESNTVISNVDPRITFTDLVGARHLDAMFANRVGQIRGKGTVAKLHLALRGKPVLPGLADSSLDNRLLVAPSMDYLESAFNHCKYGECSEAPLLEIAVPSLHDPTLAPAGHHVMSVNAAFFPYDLADGWDHRKTDVANELIGRLGSYAPGLESLIVHYELLTPRDIEEQYGAAQGHWHHGELTMHQSFMMRPLHGASQYDTPVDGLFLCGAGCHPGGGLSGLPGRNAARRVLESGAAA